MAAKREPRILILVVGGNICLYAKPYRGVVELRPATPEEIKGHLMGEENDRLVLREKDLEGKSVRIGVEALDAAKGASRKLKDSSGIDLDQWQSIADRIHKERGRYDGFVVLHGLDTMAYTASALSFMLRYLRESIIFTGSQLPLNFVRTDAVQNIICAITRAAQRTGGEEPKTVISEVLAKADFWKRHDQARLNERQSKVLNRLLDAGRGGFQGGLTTRKYVAMTKVSRATAFREISDLLEKKILSQNPAKGRSVSYDLNWSSASS